MVVDGSGKFGNALKTTVTDNSYIYFVDSPDWNLGTGDFTVEAFVNFADTTLSSNAILGNHNIANPGTNRWILSYNGNTNNMQFLTNWADSFPSETMSMTHNWTPANNTWYHVAVVRQSSNFFMYIDGVSQTLTGMDNTLIMPNLNGSMYIGAHFNGAHALVTEANNKFDEIRIRKGEAVYSGNFTPTTVPFTT